MWRACCHDRLCTTPSPNSRNRSGVTEYRSWIGEVALEHLAAALDLSLTVLPTPSSSTFESKSKSAVSSPLMRTRMSPGSSVCSAGEPRCTSDTTSMPVLFGNLRRTVGLRLGTQPEAAHFIEGRVDEHRLQRAARDRLVVLDQLQRASDAIERQVETRRRGRAAAGVQRQHAALDVDHRRSGRAAGRARRRLVVERVEVVVLADAVVRRFAIEPRERAREDRQLLAGVVADDADLATDLRALRMELELGRLDEAQLRGVVAIEAEVVHRVAIHGIQRHFLAIQEHRLRRHRPGRHDVAVGENQAALRVDDEAGRLTRHIPFGVERARQVDLDGDDAGRDTFSSVRVQRESSASGTGTTALAGRLRGSVLRHRGAEAVMTGGPLTWLQRSAARSDERVQVLCSAGDRQNRASTEQYEAPDHRQHAEG